MKIISIQFDYFNASIYDTLSNVFVASVKEKAPNTNIELIKRKAPGINHKRRCDVSNTEKIIDWIDIMDRTDEDMIFADCDMLCVNDPASAFDDDFDIGLTKRTTGNIPFNGGIVFAKNTQKAKDFIKLWSKINKELFENPQRQQLWARTKGYAGMNQAALGCLWEEYLKLTKRDIVDNKILNTKHGKIKIFPCAIWNACREDWGVIDFKKAVFIHIKSEMRNACLSGGTKAKGMEQKCRATVNLWREYANKTKQKLPANPYKKRPKISDPVMTLNRYQYENYQTYVTEQKKITELKVLKGVDTWANRENIKFLSEVIKKKIAAKGGSVNFGICHGTREGKEQAWFNKFLDVPVIGTEIWEGAAKYPNTVIWDFNKENPDWIGKFDFIYTNAFDHVYIAGQTFMIWLKTLTARGIIVIEHTVNHNKGIPTKTDPTSFTVGDIINGVKAWTGGTWQVTGNLNAPMYKNIGRKDTPVRFITIERV